ncbi:isochorismatase family protein [Candidatus Neptunochlamydia vexilliferae]|uniref:nicotinamidase n=1 Tax=Candidatus Neptunichlamydia vexilliferae TaxID=1651774 RepID=A0ABS0AXA9_9BACT|nr:isochorismatase family protein [Candidatus Neptunochlamydia vexilliferae]MBF5058763.1 Pyrazinamidase/nicotinamidase [Candidatus Neptunochlamydia vexilliferae]
MTRVLIIVDLQYDFMPGGALAVPEGDRVVPIINRLVGKFDYTIASQDWHPEGHISFGQWPVHCVAKTHGAALVKELKRDHIDRYFHKGTDLKVDSYSVFFDNDKKTKSGLDDFLQEKGVTELYIVGLATDYCVKFTVLDALELGYEVTVLKDGCRAVHDEKGALEEMEKAGAKIITSKEVS